MQTIATRKVTPLNLDVVHPRGEVYGVVGVAVTTGAAPTATIKVCDNHAIDVDALRVVATDVKLVIVRDWGIDGTNDDLVVLLRVCCRLGLGGRWQGLGRGIVGGRGFWN